MISCSLAFFILFSFRIGDGFVPGQLEGVFICRAALVMNHQELTTIRGPSNIWACIATSSNKFVSRGRFRYLRTPSDQCLRQT